MLPPQSNHDEPEAALNRFNHKFPNARQRRRSIPFIPLNAWI